MYRYGTYIAAAKAVAATLATKVAGGLVAARAGKLTGVLTYISALHVKRGI